MRIGFYVQVFESLGVEYLSAFLKSSAHQTQLFYDPLLGEDLLYGKKGLARLLSIEDLLVERMAASGLGLAAFTATTDMFPRALQVAEKLKRRANVPIVFGGIHPTSVPECVMRHAAVDYVVVGEGEQALVELANALETGAPIENIPNLCHRNNGHLQVNPVRPLIEDLDTLPFPDKTLFFNDPAGPRPSRYTAAVSRGCVFACTYCSNSLMRPLYKGKGRWYRQRSVDNVIAELKQARKQFTFDRVQFWDDNFVGNTPWLEEFAAKYPKEIGLPFFAWVHPRLADAGTVALLEKAGCGELNMGVQTVSDATRRQYLRRREENAQTTAILDAARGTNIFVSTDNIVQLPGQTLDEALDLARFYLDNPVDLPYVFVFRPYPRTGIVALMYADGSLTDEDIERLENPTVARTNSVMQDGDQVSFMKVRTLILLTSLLPGFLTQFLLRKGRYRFLPIARTSTVLTVLCGFRRRLFTRKRHMPTSFRLSEYLRHWLRFVLLALMWRLRSAWRHGPAREGKRDRVT